MNQFSCNRWPKDWFHIQIRKDIVVSSKHRTAISEREAERSASLPKQITIWVTNGFVIYVNRVSDKRSIDAFDVSPVYHWISVNSLIFRYILVTIMNDINGQKDWYFVWTKINALCVSIKWAWFKLSFILILIQLVLCKIEWPSKKIYI